MNISATGSSPAVTTASGLASAGAAAIPSSQRRWSSWLPLNSTSRLSEKYRKKVRLVSPARSAISATVVASYPCSSNRVDRGAHQAAPVRPVSSVTCGLSIVDDTGCHARAMVMTPGDIPTDWRFQCAYS